MLEDPRHILAEPRIDSDGTWWSNCEVCGYACYLSPGATVWLDGGCDSPCPTPPWNPDRAHEPENVRRIALVSCGKVKLDHPAPARELYTGNLFQAARRHVEGTGFYDGWFILSAKHGLVHPDAVLDPYDATMPTNAAEKQRWARSVEYGLRIRHRFCEWTGGGGFVELDLFAGKAYIEPLTEVYGQRRREYRLADPLQGLQVGERLHWFAERQPVPA